MCFAKLPAERQTWAGSARTDLWASSMIGFQCRHLMFIATKPYSVLSQPMEGDPENPILLNPFRHNIPVRSVLFYT